MSPTAYARAGGAWVQSGLTGKVRVGGVDVAFAPPDGPEPEYEALEWPAEPTLDNGFDSTTYTMGIRFSVASERLSYGGRWRVPTSTGDAPASGYQFRIWTVSGGTTVASKAFDPAGHEGTDLDILFDTPVTLDASPTLYVASVHTKRYTYRAKPTDENVYSPSTGLVGDEGRLVESSDPTAYPSGNFSALYFISPLTEIV